MKLVNGIIVLGLFVTSAMSSAHAATYEAGDDSIESKLCVAAATKSRIALLAQSKYLKPATVGHSNLRFMANHLYCNGVNIAEFAQRAGNERVALRLNRYRKKSVQIQDIASVRHGKVSVVKQ